MDNNNWRPGAPGDNQMMDNNASEWRIQLQSDSRQRIVSKIMETLKKHLPISGPEGMQELKKIAVRFEEKIYTAATSQSDYLRKISLKMLTMETKTQNTGAPNSNASGSTQNPPDPASHSMQTQVRNQGQPPVPLPNQSQGRQQLLSQSIQNNIAPAGVQSSSGLTSALPSVTGLSQPTMPNAVGQSSNLQGISGISQNSVSNNSMGQQGIPSNILANSQRQMQGRPHPQQVVPQQHQQQSTNPQQYIYQQQQMQHQMQKQKAQQGNMQPSLMQSHIQQHPTQLQSSQQSLVQISSGGLQPSQSTLQQTQPSLMQPSSQQNQQTSVLRQQQSQQNQLVGQQQSNGTNVHQNLLIGQQNIVSDLQQQQHQQQHQRLNNLSSMQQQQLISQQNNISNLQQQLGPQNSGGNSGLQQQLGTQSGVSNLVGNLGFDKNTQHQQSMHMLQQQGKGAGQQQQAPQISSTLLQPLQGQQQSQSQMVSQLQPSQIQQLGLQQQSNSLHQDMQQRLSMQTQNVIDQKPIFQSQRALPEASSTSIDSTAQTGHANGADWQEEFYQKVKSMKELYFPELSDMHNKISIKFQQSENLQAPKEQIERLRGYKSMLERMIQFLQIQKNQIPLSYRGKINQFEKQIVGCLTINRPKKPNSLQQQNQQQQLQPPNGHQMNLQQENQMNPQMQPTNLQGNVMNSLQTGSMLESGQGNTMGSLSQGGMGSLQQNVVGASQQMNPNTLSQNNLNVNPLQLNSSSLQHHHLKQQQEQQQLLQVRQQVMGGFKPGMSQQQRLAHHHQQLKAGAQFPISSPQLLQSQSPQISQHSSPQIDQQNLLSSLTKAGTPLQSVNSPFVVPSPSTPLAPSPLPGDPEKQIPGVSSLSNVGNLGQTQAMSSLGQPQSLAIGTPGISASPLLAEFTSLDGTASAMVSGKSTATELPIDRLLKAVKSMSSTLGTAASDIQSFISLSDRIAGSAPGNGSRAAIGEDLVAVTKSRMQLKNVSTHDGNSATKKMRRDTSAMPLNAASSAGSVDGLEALDSESTATSMMERAKVEANPALMDEIDETNQRLIDTVVTVSDEDIDPMAAEVGEGTVVKCSFIAVSLGPALKARYNSGQMSQIQPLRLLVPTNYPKSSPILDNFPVELSNNSEDLSANTRSKFSTSLRCLSQPMSLKEMVKTWDKCAREVIVEYARKHGGGNFSSTYGTWKSCMGLP
ncbi:hypothetical protein GIB67_016962 [Kingdonia uniflora]|uniref:Mediator complex subunit 15 KIX domain-containing protein n=1 Tax=Kingdonia uniflora TaxID=39325 RepID=A0A7J7M3Q3_9MAGN|nr:hypothetical protein GIB67_016962 [Kingdonia uniflora]